MNRIDRIFQEQRAAGKRVLMPFVCGGHPLVGGLGGLLGACERGGAGIVEIGIPFSDPIADGPVIAAAMHRAIAAGATPHGVLDQIGAARQGLSIGIVAMVSVSIVLRGGVTFPFIRDAVAAGVDGFIFPDAPIEESEGLIAACRDAGAVVSLLVSPSTNPERIARITSACSGFVYVLARAGITGERRDPPAVGPIVQAVRRTTQLPIACGFGISTADQVRIVVAHVDGAIVGSSLVRRLDEAGQGAEDVERAAESFVRELASGLAQGA